MNIKKIRNKIRLIVMIVVESFLLIKISELGPQDFLISIALVLFWGAQLLLVIWLFIKFFELEEDK